MEQSYEILRENFVCKESRLSCVLSGGSYNAVNVFRLVEMRDLYNYLDISKKGRPVF